MIINNLSFETNRGSRSARHWLLTSADWLSPATTATLNPVRNLPAQTLHWVPFRSQIPRREGSLHCSLPTGCRRNEQVTGQIYTDKTITSSELWQGGNRPGERSACGRRNKFNSCTPQSAKFKAAGVFWACPLYKYNRWCSSIFQPPALPSHGSPAMCPQAAVFLTGE